MNIFEWEDRYAVGVAQIDEHHRHLVDLLNKAYHDFVHHASHRENAVILDELIDYATYHFTAEEQRMQDNNYPQMAAHKQEHEEFIRRVKEMHADLQQRKVFFLEILQFLKGWLANHILRTDVELGRFLTAASSKPANQGRANSYV